MKKPKSVYKQWSVSRIGRFRIREVKRKGKANLYLAEWQSFDVPFGSGKWDNLGIKAETASGAAWEILNRLDVGDV